MRVKKFSGGGVLFSPAAVDYSAGVVSVLGQMALSASSSSSTSTSLFNNDEKGSIGLLNKTMADALIKDTLPNEALIIINNTDIFGKNIDPRNPAYATAVYSKILLRMLLAKYNKEMYNDALSKARERNALRGPAINPDGTVWVVTESGLDKKYAEEVNPTDRLVTVAELSQLRAYNPLFAFNLEIITTIENATSLKEIQDLINSIVTNIGKDDVLREFMGTKNEVNYKLLLAGIKDIIDGTTAEGIYKGKIEHSSNTRAALHLLEYIYTLLEPNLRTYLEVLANKSGIKDVVDDKTGERVDNVYVILTKFILGKISTVSKVSDLSFDKDLTKILFGPAAVGEEDKNSLENMEANPATNFYNELTQKELYTILYGGVTLLTIGATALLRDSSGKPLGWISMSQVAESMFSPLMDTSQAHFGGLLITNRDKIQVDGTKIVNLYLPLDMRAKAKGEIRPDFELFKTATALLKRTANMTDVALINRIYQQAGLPAIFEIDSLGNRVLKPEYVRFAAMKAYADRSVLSSKDVLGNPLEFDGTVELVDDDALEQTIIERFKLIDKNFQESRTGGFWFIGKHPDLYSGMVFIPMYSTIINGLEKGTNKQMLRLETALYYTPSSVRQRYNNNTIEPPRY